jgi:exosortase/archaeosortase family protein
MRDGLDPRIALALMPLLYWDAWRNLAARFEGAAAVPLLLVAVTVAVPALRRIARGEAEPVPLNGLCVALSAYVLASLTAPVLVAAGTAVTGVALLCRRIAGGGAPAAPFAGLALLALPVLPSLDFYLAFPMRLVGAALTAGLLRLNGIAVAVDGVALSWNGSLLLFDAPCSGIRMLWAALFLASGIALVSAHGLTRYARSLAIAAAMAIAGNALRAASLFYVEKGFIPALSGPVVHEAVGIAAFAGIGLATLFLLAPRQQAA